MHKLTNHLYRFLLFGVEVSYTILRENKKEIKRIVVYSKDEKLLEIKVHLGFLRAEGFKIPEGKIGLALRRLESLRKKLGIKIVGLGHELDLALHEYLLIKDKASYAFLGEKSRQIRAIDSQVEEDKLKLKINLGITKTKGFVIKGVRNVVRALEMLLVLRTVGVRVKRPRIVGPVHKDIERMLRTTFG